MDVHELVKWRWRRERKSALLFCAFACVLQAIAVVIFHFSGGSPLVTTSPTSPAMILGGMLLPVGWVVPIVAITFSIRGNLLKRDLSPENLMTMQGTLIKCPPTKDFDSDTLELDQFIEIHGVKGRLVVPLQFWKEMPERQQATCQYLRLSKLVYRINDVNPWELCQHAGILCKASQKSF
jgi:hypothetical protein